MTARWGSSFSVVSTVAEPHRKWRASPRAATAGRFPGKFAVIAGRQGARWPATGRPIGADDAAVSARIGQPPATRKAAAPEDRVRFRRGLSLCLRLRRLAAPPGKSSRPSAPPPLPGVKDLDLERGEIMQVAG